MPAWISRAVLVAGLAVTAAPSALADSPTFGELLARAEAQAAAGRRWSPHGDNMTETVEVMMDLLPTATPKQLAELSALLNSDKVRVELPAAEPPPGAQAMAGPVSRPVEMATADVADRPAPQQAAPVAPHPGPRAAELLARGQAAEREGDVSGARRFYASAAAQGDATAARNLGRLYDPAYLKRTALGGIDPDPALARYWYERAVAMGDAAAAPLLQALALR